MAEGILTGSSRFARGSSVFFAIGIVSILLFMVIPLPPILLDLLLALSITISLTILLVSIHILQPLEFSAFPSILLITTLYRLSLNVASTRLILLHGEEGPRAAGSIINVFGQFVVGGSYIVGIIVFIILVVINFVVITKGAGRIAEVGARFTLDALPGKQMSIDADLNAGLIREGEARARRRVLEQEADFYGAMDGASKFVRGDAIASLLITGINIVAGFIIGIFQFNMDVATAAETYTILTVGDGLVSQIPALLISSSSGIVVSRVATGQELGSEITSQLFAHRRALFTVSGILALFAFLPGMPALTFLALGGLMTIIGVMLKPVRPPEEPEIPPEERPTEAEEVEALLPIDLLSLEVGFGLITLVEGRSETGLVERIHQLRRRFARELGILVPPVHIMDNLDLPVQVYRLLIRGIEVARGEVMPDRLLAMNPGHVDEPVAGIETVEPVFGMNAIWIDPEQRARSEILGYYVIDPASVVATHLSEVIRNNAHEFLGRQELQRLLDVLRRESPRLVEELIPNILSAGDVLRILRKLLKEQISIRDLRSILECLMDHGERVKQVEMLTERVRERLSKQICSMYESKDGPLYVLTLKHELEEQFRKSLQVVDEELHLTVDPVLARSFLSSLEQKVQEAAQSGVSPVMLVQPELRRPVRKLLERFLPQVAVLSHREVDSRVEVRSEGEVG